MRLKFAYLCGLVFLVGCTDSRPLPTPTSATPATPTSTTVTVAPCPPCPLPGAHALSGVVRVAGVPVAGAQVGLIALGEQSPYSSGPEQLIDSRITDEAGGYSFPRVENVSFSGALIGVSKADYFTETKYIQMSEDRRLDFELERAVNISVGQVVPSQVGEVRCASGGYGGMGGARCRRFALRPRASGMLAATVSSSPASPFDVTILRPNGTIGMYRSSSVSPMEVTVTVAAELTYQIDVVLINPAIHEFELTTTLR